MRVALVDFGYPANEEEALSIAAHVGGDPEAALRMYRLAGYSDADKRLTGIAKHLKENGIDASVMYLHKKPALVPGYDVYISMMPFLSRRSLSMFVKIAGRDPVELGSLRFYREAWRELIIANGEGALVFHSAPPDGLYEIKLDEFSGDVCGGCPRAYVSYREGWMGPPLHEVVHGGALIYPAGFWCDNSEVRYELLLHGISAKALYPDQEEIARGLAEHLRGA